MLLQFFALWDDLLSIYRIRSLSISMLGLFSKSICFYFPVQSIFGVPGVHLSKDPGYRSSAFSHNSGKSRRQSMLLWGSKRFWKIPKKSYFGRRRILRICWIDLLITAQRKVVFSLILPPLNQFLVEQQRPLQMK